MTTKSSISAVGTLFLTGGKARKLIADNQKKSWMLLVHPNRDFLNSPSWFRKRHRNKLSKERIRNKIKILLWKWLWWASTGKEEGRTRSAAPFFRRRLKADACPLFCHPCGWQFVWIKCQRTRPYLVFLQNINVLLEGFCIVKRQVSFKYQDYLSILAVNTVPINQMSDNQLINFYPFNSCPFSGIRLFFLENNKLFRVNPRLRLGIWQKTLALLESQTLLPKL